MAGDAISRLKTKMLIFFSVTIKQKFDTSTRAGRTRLGYFAALVALLILAVVVLSNGETESSVMIHGSAHITRSTMFDDDDDDEGDKGVHGRALEEDDEEDEENDDDENEDDEGANEGGLANLKAEQQARQSKMKGDFSNFFSAYHHGADIKTFLDGYVSEYSGLDILKTTIIGKTYEKRDLEAYTLGRNGASKHVIVIGTEHGSEWSVPMYLTYVISRLTQLYGINDDVTQVLDEVNFHVIPYVNPDGAAYTTGSKSHRDYSKNRAPVRRHSSAKGVELREDWAVFSQLETKAVRDFVSTIQPKGLAGFVNVQCCASAVTAPRNSTCISQEKLDERQRVGDTMAREMTDGMSHKFQFSVLTKTKRSRSKAHPDDFAPHWAMNKLGVGLSFTISAGGTLPPESSSKHKKHSSTPKMSEKKLMDIPTKELVTGSREITKGIVALGKSLIGGSGSESALCDGVEMGDDSVPPAVDDSTPKDGEEEEEEEESADDEDSREDPEDDEERDDEDEGEDTSMDGETETNTEGDDTEDSFSEEEDEEEEEKPAEREELQIDENSSEESMDPDAAHALELSRAISASSSKPKKDIQFVDSDTKRALRFARGVETVNPEALQEQQHISPVEANSADHFLYFAYGPDMMYELLYAAGITSAQRLTTGILPGHGIDYTYYSRKVWKSGVADIYTSKHSKVYGVIYRIHNKHKDLLDRHNLAGSEDSHVSPVSLGIEDANSDRTFTCHSYKVPLKMNGEDIGGRYRRFKPSRQYRNCVIKGAKAQHLPEDYIEKKLRSISPLFSDKIGSSLHRNPAIGTLCDVEHKSSSRS
uniref:Peptidase M14 domain-containing protein n=1 Tax=Mucochytrium quahogii TaxID=96639 RepID=A0A7S2W8S0_9STRA|mmetsp:Transcript_14022/g.24826  ORF Transcript_14022/g.24826 Transcript_14022/m.24826 type:complete len:819 (-) Transcript_14022:45-2501(-)